MLLTEKLAKDSQGAFLVIDSLDASIQAAASGQASLKSPTNLDQVVTYRTSAVTEPEFPDPPEAVVDALLSVASNKSDDQSLRMMALDCLADLRNSTFWDKKIVGPLAIIVKDTQDAPDVRRSAIHAFCPE